jgi:capsular polysaccharide biosynthesis protein
MNIFSFKNEKIYKSIYNADQNNREINIYKLENCAITGHNLYYPNVLLKTQLNKFILPLLEKTMSLNSGTIYEKNGMKYNDNSDETKVLIVYETPVFFFVYNTDNYFHYLYDSIPYLISYFELKKELPNIKLLMQYPNEQKNSFYNFVTELLEIINIKKDDIILIDDTSIYKEIYISTSYTHDIDSNLPPRQEIYDFYKDIAKNVKQKYENINTPKKIYISRRTWIHNDFSNIGTNYTTRRRLVNEDELIIHLQEKGYTEVFTEKLTTIEKIMYFTNATHVVGAIGGGIANVLFSSKETKLEVLVSPTFMDINSRFKYSLDCVDVYYNINTEHVEKTDLKTYMRIKTKDGKIIGEIEEIHENSILVSYTDGSNTGWNAQNEYKKIILNINDIEKMDNGLNSPWRIIYTNNTL